MSLYHRHGDGVLHLVRSGQCRLSAVVRRVHVGTAHAQQALPDGHVVAGGRLVERRLAVRVAHVGACARRQ